MDSNKIIRTICYFTDVLDRSIIAKVNGLAEKLTQKGFLIQTKRICTKEKDIKKLEEVIKEDQSFIGGLTTLHFEEFGNYAEDLYASKEIFFSLDLAEEEIQEKHVDILFDMTKRKPEKTFHFAYVFENSASSPFFPSAQYEKNGFAIGFQSTDLSEECNSLQEWLDKSKEVWQEVCQLFQDNNEFLGIDTSVAPFATGKSSLVGIVKKLGYDFSRSATTDLYLRITKFIKEENPKPVGLCGLMFPALEDFELADEYEKRNFSIERNIYLSLHSGLGVDTYPIGIDEDPQRVLEVLRLLQGLATKYKKPLSARFVSDGKAKIGDKTDFKNQYLKDVVVRKL